MAERYIEPRWTRDYEMACIRHFRGGFVEEGIRLDDAHFDCLIPDRDLHSLIAFLDEQGLIKPRLDERLRDEDLKITHRLMDLLDKSISG